MPNTMVIVNYIIHTIPTALRTSATILHGGLD